MEKKFEKYLFPKPKIGNYKNIREFNVSTNQFNVKFINDTIHRYSINIEPRCEQYLRNKIIQPIFTIIAEQLGKKTLIR